MWCVFPKHSVRAVLSVRYDDLNDIRPPTEAAESIRTRYILHVYLIPKRHVNGTVPPYSSASPILLPLTVGRRDEKRINVAWPRAWNESAGRSVGTPSPIDATAQNAILAAEKIQLFLEETMRTEWRFCNPRSPTKHRLEIPERTPVRLPLDICRVSNVETSKYDSRPEKLFVNYKCFFSQYDLKQK